MSQNNEQAEAYRLAAWLTEGAFYKMKLGDVESAGRELRRQHEEIKTLRAALAAQATQPHDLQKRLADLHLYEEIGEHYAKCNPGPENLRDWVAERMNQPAQAGPSEPVAIVGVASGIQSIGWIGGYVPTHNTKLYTHPAPVRQPLADEKVEDMRADANRGYNIEKEDYFKAVRDAETAHGITAKGAAHD